MVVKLVLMNPVEILLTPKETSIEEDSGVVLTGITRQVPPHPKKIVHTV